MNSPQLGREAVPEAWCGRAEGSVPHGGEPGTGDLEEHGVCGSEGVGGGL